MIQEESDRSNQDSTLMKKGVKPISENLAPTLG